MVGTIIAMCLSTFPMLYRIWVNWRTEVNFPLLELVPLVTIGALLVFCAAYLRLCQWRRDSEGVRLLADMSSRIIEKNLEAHLIMLKADRELIKEKGEPRGPWRCGQCGHINGIG